MSQSDHPEDGGGPPPAFRPGDRVWVRVMGTWQSAVVLGTDHAGRVLARYRRLDGELDDRAFPSSAVLEAGAL